MTARSCALFRRGLAQELENLNINILVHLKVEICRFQVSIRTNLRPDALIPKPQTLNPESYGLNVVPYSPDLPLVGLDFPTL